MTVYVVRGSTGEYSDRVEWLVCAYSDLELAEQHVLKASECARVEYTSKGRFDSHDDAKNPYDANMQMDYNGTRYWYQAVEVRSALPEVSNT